MFKLSYILIFISLFAFIRPDDENSFITSSLTERNRTYMLFVSEDAPIGHSQIIDNFDSSFCSSYSISNNAFQQDDVPFEVVLNANDSCSFNLIVIRLLDREQTPMYTLRRLLINDDDLRENNSIVIQLSIVVLDVNDHVPQFESEHFHFFIPENSPANTLIGRVQAHDPDIFLNGKVSYTLFGHDLVESENRTMFRIDRDTGDLYLMDEELDFEKKREYTLMVEAKDHGDIEATLWPSVPSYADIIITVEDVNDHKPRIVFTMPNDDRREQTFKSMNLSTATFNNELNRLVMTIRSKINLLDNDAELIEMSREEPLPADTLIGLINLRDNDQMANGILSLELETFGHCSNKFSKNDSSFCLMNDVFRLSVFRPNVYGLFTQRTLDRDEQENYVLHLIGNDNGDRPLKIDARRAVSRPISSMNLDDFLRRRIEFNREKEENSFLALRSELFVCLTLSDINDNPPVFDENFYQINIDENQPRNSYLTRFHAHDRDKGRNGTVRYELMIKQNELFSLDSHSGVLRTKQTLDREICENYRLAIRAHDLGIPNRKYSSIVFVDLHVNNVNDHVPYFLDEFYHFQVDENLPIGTIVGRLTIADRDEQEPIEKFIDLSMVEDSNRLKNLSKNFHQNPNHNPAKHLEFFFVETGRNSSLTNSFTIDAQGVIRTSVVLDRELQFLHNFSIFIYDSFLKSYSLPTKVWVSVIDENDNLPYEPFLANPFELSIEQSNNDETLIYQFKPIDLDDGPNGFVTIDCLNCSSSNYFQLIENNSTDNGSFLMTKSNVTVPDGIYSLAFVLRDHGIQISRERIYTLKFNLTHRLSNDDDENDEEDNLEPLNTDLSIKQFLKRSSFFSTFSLESFQWKLLLCLLIFWLILVVIALWTCCRYERISKRKKADKQRQIHDRLERQVRQHEILGQTLLGVPKSGSFPVGQQRDPQKDGFHVEEDEVEDTSYDADHIMTDANFVLTPAATNNETNVVRYNGQTPQFGYPPSNNNLSANLNSIAIRNQSSHIGLRSTSFSRLHQSCSRCQLTSSVMNSRETILTDAATNTSYHEEPDAEESWRAMNRNNQMLYENASTVLHNDYHFEPIDHDFPSIEVGTVPSSAMSAPNQPECANVVQRPVPINNRLSNTVIERPKKYNQQPYIINTKRNSTVGINPTDSDSTTQSYTLPRSITSDQIANNQTTSNRSTTNNRLYYYPSVQDVLDALNRRSFDKESFV